MKKSKIQIQLGDLFVHYKQPCHTFYIKGMNQQETEFMVGWFAITNRVCFYSEFTLKGWINKGVYHYYPVIP